MSKDEQHAPEGTRPPNVEDLLLICRCLNEQQARYIIVGGLAIFEHGFARMTEDVDLLVDQRPENVARVKAALACLPDRASLDVEDGDVQNYTVVRINDEITVDLMGSACGVDYEQARTNDQSPRYQGRLHPLRLAAASLENQADPPREGCPGPVLPPHVVRRPRHGATDGLSKHVC